MQYKVVRLIKIEGQAILEEQDPGLLTLMPLMKRPKGMDANRWLGECIKATSTADVDPQDRDDLLAALGIFGGLIHDSGSFPQ